MKAASWPPSAFHVGDTLLVLESEDRSFIDGVRRLYGDCEADPKWATGDSVRLRVECDADFVVVTVEGDAIVDLGDFLMASFGDRGCRRLAPVDGLDRLECQNPLVQFVVRDRSVIFPAGSPWQGLSANLGLGLAMLRQPDVTFLHAACVGLRGTARGVVFAGPKSAGKTTTALGLSVRGHRFLGDEVVGVESGTGRLVPVLRAISMRDGPCASGMEAALDRLPVDRSVYPDGQARRVVRASTVFDTQQAPTHLHALVFLDGFEEAPRIRRVDASLDLVSRLTPVASTVWGVPAAVRAMRLLRILGSVPLFGLRLGPPDATSELLDATFTGSDLLCPP